MKNNIITIDIIKQNISEMKGEKINMTVNRGRRKIENFTAIIENVYPSVFTVKYFDSTDTKTYSYSDVLCGVVALSKII